MKETDIRRYAGLMQELGLTGLEITEDNKVVRLERNPAPVSVDREVVRTQDACPCPQEPLQDYHSVKSTMVGVFYSAPAENAAPFVDIGDRVEPGQTLCIIEAMKLMNELCADYAGTVAEICVTNGQVVEYGTELFKIKR